MLQPIMAHRGTADERPGRTMSECRPGVKQPVPRSRWKVCRKKQRECAKFNVGWGFILLIKFGESGTIFFASDHSHLMTSQTLRITIYASGQQQQFWKQPCNLTPSFNKTQQPRNGVYMVPKIFFLMAM